MKYLYLTLAAAACAMTMQAAAPKTSQLAGEKRTATQNVVTVDNLNPRKALQRVTVEELFAAPENTVLDGPYIPDQVGFQGFQNSDLGRPEMPTRFYQAFSGCTKTVSSLRVIGMFNYFDEVDYDWLHCESRGNIDENYTMTEPVTMEVAFYREDEKGYPGEVIYKKNIDIVGRYMGLTYGNEGNEMPLYEFTAELGEEIRLESGFMSFAAADMGDSPACWLSLFTADTSHGFAMMDMGDYGLMYANMPCIFSFMGDGAMAAKKALRVDKIMAPSAGACGTHEKITANIINVGSDDINDARLELWVDGKLIATEDVDVAVPAGASYAYTFMHRADLSADGKHEVVVKNATPGDEDISRRQASASTYVCAEGEFCESGSTYEDETFISYVGVGNIENESGWSSYSDYYDTHVLNLHPGEAFELTVEPLGETATGVWIDWNENGTFDDEGEFMGYAHESVEEPVVIRIPEGMSVKEGKKRMRLVMNYSNTLDPCGEYYFGETEDYGVMISRNANTAAVEVSVDEISESAESVGVKDVAFELANAGDAALDAKVSVDYLLPTIYNEPRNVAPAAEFGARPKVKAFAGQAAPAAEEDVQQVLGYDGGMVSSVALGNYDAAVFGQYYPSNVMQAIKGMKVSSVDVYFKEASETASIKIYGQGSYGVAGKVIAEQAFTPVADSWNHVVLDTPVEITGEDFWYGVEIRNMKADGYYIGIDNGPAVAGFGDLCNVGGEMWWSMADLGVNSNICIRANVTGERSAAIDWLSVDKKELALDGGEKATLTASLKADGLSASVYEAFIKVESNDELMPVVKIPVYLTNGIATGIDTSKLGRTSVKVAEGCIVITSAEANIAGVKAYDMSGRTLADTKPGRVQQISLDSFESGVYVIAVSYADGKSESFKIAVAR